MAQIRGRGQSGQCLWDKMSEWHHTGGETGHTLLSIPPQPSEIWLQHPKNYKAALMKKRNHYLFLKSIHLLSIFIWVELPAAFEIKVFFQK